MTPDKISLLDVADNLAAGIGIITTDGIIVFANKMACSSCGLSRDEIIGENMADLIWWSYDEKVREKLIESIKKSAKGKTVRYEEKVLTFEGYSNVQLGLRPVKNKNGKIKYIVTEGQNITRIKEKEKDLQKAYDIINSVSVFAGSTDYEGRITYANRMSLKTAGYSFEDVKGKHFWKCGWFAHSDDIKQKIKAAVTKAQQGAGSKFEITASSRDKSKIFPLLYSCTPIFDKTGKTAWIAHEGSVITDIKKKQSRIEKERKTFSLMAEATVFAKNVEDLCQKVLPGLSEILEFDSAMIWLYDETDGNLYVKAHYGISEKDRDKLLRPYHIDDPGVIAAHVARTCAPIFAPDILTHEMSRLFPERVSQFKHTRSFVSWPLLDSEKNVLGVCSFLSSTRKVIEEEDRLFFESMASMFAIAIENKVTQISVEKSLKEKELMLQEIHHRVKNNLQVISSLLNLQSRSIDNNSIKASFRESTNRIKSMAYVHEMLYRSDDMSKINLNDYIKQLISNLLRSLRTKGKKISFTISNEPVFLGIDRAVPCGLIINEIVSNSLKYAFCDQENGEINVNMMIKNSGRLSLMISDNGKGIPGEIDFRNTDSLGLQLVNMLTDQLDGTVQLNRANGTKFIIDFPLH